MATEIHKQNILSEHLLLLHQLGYSDRSLNYPYRLHKLRYSDPDEQRDARLLDTIAAALATGRPGDLYAAAFDKRQRFSLVLAKNGSPTSEDRDAAKELISLIQDPKTNQWQDLFPFLIKRCRNNINHRIERLAACMTLELSQDFEKALDTYTPNVDLQSEFVERALFSYGDEIPTFPIVWHNFIHSIVSKCKPLDLDPDPTNMPTMMRQFDHLCLWAFVVLHSRFFKWLVDNKSISQAATRVRLERFKRRLAKCCQYVYGIHDLIHKAKRLPPISHEWVTKDFTSSSEGPFSVASSSAHDAIECIAGQPLDEPSENRIATILSTRSQVWDNGAKGAARVHAELRIILHFGLPLSPPHSEHAIGVSKRSCLACELWIVSHNDFFHTQWMTSGSYGKPCPNWALPGGACSYQGEDRVDKEVTKQVYHRLWKKVSALIRRNTLSDDMAQLLSQHLAEFASARTGNMD